MLQRSWRTFSTSKNRPIQQLFQEKLQEAKSLPPLDEKDNHLKLKMYALFKQATVGPCTDPKPGMLDFIGKYKWEAWTNLKEMSKDDAMSEYIEIIDGLLQQQAPAQKEDVEISIDDGLLSIHLNRKEKYNALNWGMYEAISTALNENRENSNVRAVHLHSSGEMFCSGNDLSMFSNVPKEGPEKLAADGAKLLRTFVDSFITFPLPIVASVHGPAIGISVTILALCDLVYAHHQATFHTPFTSLGQSPEACSSILFPEIMGPARANAMLLMGEKLSAQEAKKCGFVTDCFGSNFQRQVDQRIRHLLELPPNSVRQSKQLIRAPSLQRLKEANEKECKLLQQLWTSEECFAAISKRFMKK